MANRPDYGAKPIDPNAVARAYPIAASQTIAKGDFVYLNSGQVTIATATTAELCGVAAEPASGRAANADILIWDNPREVFEVCADGISSSIVSGNTRDIVGSTGAQMLDADGTTYNVLLVLREHKVPENDNTAAYARWEVMINKHAFENIST